VGVVVKARRRPCAECPFRRDVEPGQFPPERYEALRNTHGYPGNEAPLGAPWFGCHKMPEGAAPGGEIACAGWLAVEGLQHIGVRLAACEGVIPPEALRPAEGWPELFDSYDEMAARQGRQEGGTDGS
jgi:hypothetical protein